jgi:hypothetical protein
VENTKNGELHLKANEKREYPRQSMAVSVRYKLLTPEEAEKAMARHFDPDKMMQDYSQGESSDVSKNGLSMYVNEEIRLKSLMAVTMYLSVPGISCNCKALAEVVRRESNTEGGFYAYKVGLRFVKIIHHNLKNYTYLNLNDLLNIKEQSFEGQAGK